MKVRIELGEAELRALVQVYLLQLLQHMGDGFSLKAEDIKIEVRSKQNYKSEWESAAFRAVYERR